MRFSFLSAAIIALGGISLQACLHTPDKVDQSVETHQSAVYIPHTKYTLENGLTVILHQDTSDPLVHVDVTYHVGSAREEVGKSGFAHFFEHMMFQGSKHVADEQHFKVITESGGNLNGTTNMDRTNYYQTVPANQLEKVLWLEADRMGFLLEAVTQEKFEVQRETVKNERAQRVDNQPYGLRSERVGEALYPLNHPYSWSTIGYVEDLDRVTVDDLKAFFKRWYGPNNAVLTIGGDIDVAQTKAWIEKYFGPISVGPVVEQAEKAQVVLENDRYLTLEDDVHLPLLQITLPTVYGRHPDEAPLDVLADILGGGKTSLFYKNLVKKGAAVQAIVSHPCRELACEFQLLALANPQNIENLNELEKIIDETLKEFEDRGVTEDDLLRTKAAIESSTVYGLQSVAGKVSTLAANQTFYGEPDLVAKDLSRYSNVTKQDVMRVYNTYIKDKPAVKLSLVPRGQTELELAEVNFVKPERNIAIDTVTSEAVNNGIIDNFDRSIQPPAGEAPVVKVPDFWRDKLAFEIDILGITSDETPTVSLSIALEGGSLVEPLAKAGVASLTAAMLNESTQARTSEVMANDLAKLGSSIHFSASGRYTQIYVSSLTKNLTATLALLEEKLFKPKFDMTEFETLKARTLQGLQQDEKNPSSQAQRAKYRLMYGDENRIGWPDSGTQESIAALTIDDVKHYYQTYINASKASAIVVSDLAKNDILKALTFLSKWHSTDYDIPPYSPFPKYSEQIIYLVDNPGAVQSVVSIIKRSRPYDATGDFFYTRLMNFPLGGAFNSRINLNLREDKGYTYGASSVFLGGKTLGWFEASADLNGENTADGIREIFNELKAYRENGMTDSELAFMRSAYTLSDALEYETPSSKASFLRHLYNYQLDNTYRDEQSSIIKNVTLEQLNAVAKRELQAEDMQIVVVGDKSKILPQLQSLKLPIEELVL